MACRHDFRRQIEIATFMKTTLAHQLANYSSSFRFEDLSKEVVHEVKRRVIDRNYKSVIDGLYKD